MPLRGDRLRWPPRPGKKSPTAAGQSGTRRSLLTDEHPAHPDQPMRQPNERDESADQHSTAPRDVIKQAHADLENGQMDTDCRNNAPTVIDQTVKPAPGGKNEGS